MNFEGAGQFKFALVNADGTTTYWSNDGTSTAGSEPTDAVSLTVTKGLYSVLLGDTALAHMTAIPATVFTNPDVRLRVWFNDGTHGFQHLAPDQRIAAVGYAMMAGNVPDGTITGAKIAAATVAAANIAAGAVGNDQLANAAVGSAKLAPAAVQAANIATGAVGTAQIGGGAIDSTKLATGAVRARTSPTVPLGLRSSPQLRWAAANWLPVPSGDATCRRCGRLRRTGDGCGADRPPCRQRCRLR